MAARKSCTRLLLVFDGRAGVWKDESERTWGQLFCDLSYEAIQVPPEEIYALTLEMDGR